MNRAEQFTSCRRILAWGTGSCYPFRQPCVTIHVKALAATMAGWALGRDRPGARSPGSPSVALDERLVLAAQRGDRAAFGGIYEAYYDRIFRYALARTGSPTEAEDLAAEVFLKAYEAIGSYSARGVPFGAWLFRIAHNLVVDHLRRRSRRPTTTLSDALPLFQADPEELVAQGLTIRDIYAAMQEITEAQRQVIALRFGAGLSIAETAQAMKRKEGAIKALQHSAIGALRRCLAKRGHELP